MDAVTCTKMLTNTRRKLRQCGARAAKSGAVLDFLGDHVHVGFVVLTIATATALRNRGATDRPRSFTPELLLILGNVAEPLVACSSLCSMRATRVVLMLERKRPFQQAARMFERRMQFGV